MKRQRYLETALCCRRDGETFLESLARLGNVRDVTIGRAAQATTETVPSMPLGNPSWFVRAALRDGGEVVGEASRLDDAALLALVELARSSE